ncbi:ribbon-helix-helix protein, CopG family [Enterococcus sp. BWM-S5]|uniref:Ribbon-helix-helix protein, CopG family n=1 Tax=Enterococcus larvae TaxID=2794352 RepID=A0ABS4CGU0_9ENTE|nr:ribbon-helix-helix protein, CopG family [Enterococcus larvae]MBP1045492.1 ribbon-helix-helix protein, CopG family [Enterococcus larvae]
MSNETEKLTINLGVVELAQIDVLVEQGIYSNRSDLIRTAVRKQLEVHSERIDQQLLPVSTKKEWTKTVGILSLSKKNLEKLAEDNEKISVSVIGMLIIDQKVNRELFEKTVDDVLIRGKLVASDEIKELVREMN